MNSPIKHYVLSTIEDILHSRDSRTAEHTSPIKIFYFLMKESLK